MDTKDKTKTSCVNMSTVLSVVAIIISLITIALFFFKVTEYSVVDSGTFISIMTAFIAIIVTILIGFQVYNAIDLRADIKKYIEDFKKLEKKSEDFVAKTEEDINHAMVGIYLSMANNASGEYIQIFRRLHSALYHSLKCENNYGMIDDFLKGMEESMDDFFVNTTDIQANKENCNYAVSDIRETEKKIKTDSKFSVIKTRYTAIMKRFYEGIAPFDL